MGTCTRNEDFHDFHADTSADNSSSVWAELWVASIFATTCSICITIRVLQNGKSGRLGHKVRGNRDPRMFHYLSSQMLNKRQQCQTVNKQECDTQYEQQCSTQYKDELEYYTETECKTDYKKDCEYQWEGTGNNK